MITIDKGKCAGCLKCVKVCPFTALEEKNGKPELNQGKLCLECMHCAAVCNAQAITYGSKAAVLDREIKSAPDNFLESLENHIMTRRSYRHFKETPVDRKVLERVLETAAWSASAKNQHDTKYIVIDDKEIIKKIMDEILEFAKATGAVPEITAEYARGNNPVMGNAPTLLLAYAPDDNVNPLGDTFIKLSAVEMLLQAQNIGTCWAGYLTRLSNGVPGVKKILDIPEGSSVYGAFMMGYPDNEEYHKIPKRLKRPEVKWL